MHSFEDITPLRPLLPDKAIKLFFFTLPKTLSLKFNADQCTKKLSFGIRIMMFQSSNGTQNSRIGYDIPSFLLVVNHVQPACEMPTFGSIMSGQ